MSYRHLRTLMIIQGPEAFCKRRFPASFHIGADREHNSPATGQQRIRLRDSREFLQGFPSEPLCDLRQCRLFPFRKQQSTLDLTSQDPVLCSKIFVPQQEFLIDR